MSYKVTFSAFAESDLDAIDDYIARDSPERAIAWVRVFAGAARSLRRCPSEVRGGRTSVRVFGRSSFERRAVIAYRIEGATVRILRSSMQARIIPVLGGEIDDSDES